MDSDNYYKVVVKNIKEVFQKKRPRIPRKCRTPLRSGYKTEDDDTVELKSDGMQWYQEIIGHILWAIDLGRVDILLEVALLSQNLALPHEGHLDQALHVIGYLKEHKNLRIIFDCGHP